VQSDKTLKK